MRNFFSSKATDDRGAILIIVSLLMVGLLGITAVAFDLGYKRQLKRDLQTAADAAALAGVQALAEGDSVWGETQDYITRNGYSSATINNPPASGSFAGDADCVEVVPSETFEATFAVILGRDDLSARARAVACMTASSGGNYAIFAGAESCSDKNLVFNGSINGVVGAVHSNDDIDISGSDNDFNNAVTYVGSGDVGGSNNDFPGSDPSKTGVEPWPVEFDIDDFKPGGSSAAAAEATGNYFDFGNSDITSDDIGNPIPPGIYYTNDGDVDLSDSDLTVQGGGGVTFVSNNGMIKLSGSDQVLAPYVDDLLAFSNRGTGCDLAAFDMSGSNHDWKGIVYAPRGLVKMAGSSNTSLTGSIVAYTVEMSGSDISLIADADGGGGAPVFFLAE